MLTAKTCLLLSWRAYLLLQKLMHWMSFLSLPFILSVLLLSVGLLLFLHPSCDKRTVLNLELDRRSLLINAHGIGSLVDIISPIKGNGHFNRLAWTLSKQKRRVGILLKEFFSISTFKNTRLRLYSFEKMIMVHAVMSFTRGGWLINLTKYLLATILR